MITKAAFRKRTMPIQVYPSGTGMSESNVPKVDDLRRPRQKIEWVRQEDVPILTVLKEILEELKQINAKQK